MKYLIPYEDRQADLVAENRASERARRLDLFAAAALTGLLAQHDGHWGYDEAGIEAREYALVALCEIDKREANP